MDTPVPIPNTEVKHPHADGTTVSRGRVGSRRIFLFSLTNPWYPCRMSAVRFIAYKGLQNLLLIYPVYTLLFQFSGLSLEQVSLLLAIWSVPVVLFEIPSGILSDRWSRKGMLVLSSLLKICCFLFWMLGSTFLSFALGFIAWGLAEAFASGSEEALLYDSLKRDGQEERFDTVYSQSQAVASLCVGISCLAGGFFVDHFGFSFVLFSSLIVSVLALLLVLGFQEANLFKENPSQHEVTSWATLCEALHLLIHSPKMLSLAALMIIPLSVSGILDEYDPLIASSYGLGSTAIGLWVGGRYFLEALGSSMATRLHRLGSHAALFLSLLAALLLLCVGWFQAVSLLPLYFLFYFLCSSAAMIQETVLQHQIESQGRSTVHSVVSLATNLHAIMVFSLLGFFSMLGTIILFLGFYMLFSSGFIGLLQCAASSKKAQ